MNSNIWIGNVEFFSNCSIGGMKMIMLGITWRIRKRASWIREKTKGEDMVGHIICQRDRKRTVRIIE